MRADLAPLLQNRQERLQVNLRPEEAAAVARLAAEAGASRSSIARALLVSGMRQQLQAVA
jgi:hypothetical protein